MGRPVANAMIGSGYVPQNASTSEGSPLAETSYNGVPVRQPGPMNPIVPVTKNGVDVPSFMTGFGKNKSAY